jgi:hypothetical protein
MSRALFRGGAWMAKAVCRTPEASALPWTADAITAAERTKMTAVCSTCPVMDQCEEFSKRASVSAGFWAGRERRRSDGPDEPEQLEIPWAS